MEKTLSTLVQLVTNTFIVTLPYTAYVFYWSGAEEVGVNQRATARLGGSILLCISLLDSPDTMQPYRAQMLIIFHLYIVLP